MAASVDSDDNILLFTNNGPPQQNIAQNVNLIYKRTNTTYLNILASKS